MDESEIYFENSSSYLADLIRVRECLTKSKGLLAKLDELLSEELDLALMGAKKAKSEILKDTKLNVVKPIK